jgi:hypothetical protein
MDKFFRQRETVAAIKAATFLGFVTYFSEEVKAILLAIAGFIH